MYCCWCVPLRHAYTSLPLTHEKKLGQPQLAVAEYDQSLFGPPRPLTPAPNGDWHPGVHRQSCIGLYCMMPSTVMHPLHCRSWAPQSGNLRARCRVPNGNKGVDELACPTSNVTFEMFTLDSTPMLIHRTTWAPPGGYGEERNAGASQTPINVFVTRRRQPTTTHKRPKSGLPHGKGHLLTLKRCNESTGRGQSTHPVRLAPPCDTCK